MSTYNEADHPRGEDGKYTNKNSAANPSELPDTNPLVETHNMLQSVVDDYELDYGNGELYDEDGSVYVTIEAPNSATMGFPIQSGATRKEALEEIIDYAEDFDADREFDETWSRDFANQNGFTPREFMSMLQEDQQFYRDTALAMRHELNGSKFSEPDPPATSTHDEEQAHDISYPTLTVDDDADARDTAEDALEQFELDWGAERIKDYGDSLTITCTAPNGSSRQITVPKTISQRRLLNEMADGIDDFDADEEFMDTYDPNGSRYSPSTVLTWMGEDETSFHTAARQLRYAATRV